LPPTSVSLPKSDELIAVTGLPQIFVLSALKSASETERREAFERELLLLKKYRFRDIYPLSPALNERYEKTKKPR
jgi:hypothetical protein